MTVEPHIREHHQAGFDVSDSWNVRDLGYGSVVKRASRFGVNARSPAALSVFTSRCIALGPGGNKSVQTPTKNLNLVEEIERLEPRQHIALQTQAKRNHGDDHSHANRDRK